MKILILSFLLTAFCGQANAAADEIKAPDPFFIRGLLGGSYNNPNQSDRTFQLNYGATVGAELVQFNHSSEFTSFAIGLDYETYQISDSYRNSTILMQLLFQNHREDFYYFGPEIGVRMYSDDGSIHVTTFTHAVTLAVGLLAGREFELSKDLSIGPQFHFDYFFANALASDSSRLVDSNLVIKALLALTLRF